MKPHIEECRNDYLRSINCKTPENQTHSLQGLPENAEELLRAPKREVRRVNLVNIGQNNLHFVNAPFGGFTPLGGFNPFGGF